MECLLTEIDLEGVLEVLNEMLVNRPKIAVGSKNICEKEKIVCKL